MKSPFSRRPTADRDEIVIILPSEDEGNLDAGPVIIIHTSENEALHSGKTTATSFGPFVSVRNALEYASQFDSVTEDECFKTIIGLNTVGNLVTLEGDEAREFVKTMKQKGATPQQSSGLVN